MSCHHHHQLHHLFGSHHHHNYHHNHHHNYNHNHHHQLFESYHIIIITIIIISSLLHTTNQLLGKLRRIKISDKLNFERIERIFDVEVRPGYKGGTKIMFAASMDFPKAVVFVIEELPHGVFRRDRHDLLCSYILTMKQIMDGVTVKIDLPSSQTLIFRTKDYVIKHGSKVQFADYGFPKTRSSVPPYQPTSRGDLIITFQVIG